MPALIPSFDPDRIEPAERSPEAQAAILEAAFAIYCRFARRDDDEAARQRFAKLRQSTRAAWIADAEAAFAVFERYRNHG